jgi:hypothetical protein
MSSREAGLGALVGARLTFRQCRRRALRDGVLGAPLGAGAPHVVELRPVRVDQAPQRPAEVRKLRGKAWSPAIRARLWVLIDGSHSGSHIVSIERTCSRGVSPTLKASRRPLLFWSGRPGGPSAISIMQAMVAIQMRIGMAHPFVMPLVPNGPRSHCGDSHGDEPVHSTEVAPHATSRFNQCILKFKRDAHLTRAAPKARKVG